jgi:Zn-dependent metalloprotease
MESKKITKAIMALMLFAFVSASGAPNKLRDLITGEQGRTNADVRLLPEQQIPFAPQQAKNIFGLDPNADLVLNRTENDNIGFVHYRYYQTYQGIPVENTMYIVHVKGGVLTGMSGSIVLDFDKQMDQRNVKSLTPSDAVTTAINYVGAEKYAWQDQNTETALKNQRGNASATYYPTATLTWYAPGDEIVAKYLQLCYKVDVYSVKPLSRAFYFIDAQTGKVIGKKDELYYSDAIGTCNTAYSGTQTIHSDFTGTTYRLRDLTKGNGVITLTSAGADYTNASATWSLTGANQYALDAHYGVSQTYAFYLANFGRNSVDNAGYALTSYVNESATTDNAYWDGTSMHFGNRSLNGAGITGIDVDGHELTHGVTQYTSNLNYSNQSGAMNESMSDIFGKSVQFWSKPTDVNWLLSNDMNWLIRNMSNPNQYGQPDTYLGTNWYTGTGDNGGVHTNSGVGNYMFYLLVTGGSGTNDIGNAFTVSGIGLTKADAILYRTQTVYLTPTSQYANWRTACISAATDLYGSASNEVNQVMNAWYAVGIGTPGNTGTCAVPTGLISSNIADNTATVSWSAASGAASYVLQYKAASSSTWTSVSTAATTANLTGLSSGTVYSYQVQTVCSSGGSSAFSTASTFTTTGVAPIVYCTSVGQTLDGITNVTFNTINNTTSGTTAGYTDYTSSQSTSVNQGGVYTLSVNINTGGNYTNYAKAWIDWNHDGTFSTTTEEYNLGTAVNVTNGATTLSPLTITVPSAATIGTTRMRVSTQYNAAPTPCNASFDGEVEDYSVVIGASSTCTIPSGLASSSIANTSATLSWTSTGATTYDLQWKLTSAAAWTTVSGLTTTTYALSGLTACSAYQFQVRGNCTGASSAYSSASSFSTIGCVTCTVPGGLTSASIANTGATLSWTSTGANTYDLQWKLSSAAAWTTVSGLTTTSYALSGLTACSAYQFQVRGNCTGATSAYSSPASFSTIGCVTCTVPGGLTSASIANTGATLSWTSTGANTYDLQWKLSSAAAWTTVSGLTTTSYALTGLTACSAYQFQVRGNCTGATSAYSSTSSFTTTGCTTTYCTSRGTNTTYEYISRVALGTINNTSGNNSGYGNYTSLSTNLAGNTAYTITLVPGFASTAYSEFWKVYIDYNHNGVFTDAGENVVSTSGTTSKTATFTVPTTALNGPTRMRVQMKYGSYATNSCTSFTYGEVEDYTVNVTGNAQFNGTEVVIAEPTTEMFDQNSHDIAIYPNPTSDKVHFFIPEMTDNTLIEIYSPIGSLVKLVNVNGESTEVDLSNLVEGIYFYVIKSSGNTIQAGKVMKD